MAVKTNCPMPSPKSAELHNSRPWSLDGTWWAVLLIFVGVFLTAEFTGLDLAVQDRFYNFTTGTWLINPLAPWPKAMFYTGPKYLLMLGGIALLAITVMPGTWRKTATAWMQDRRALLVCFFTLGLVPLAVGQIKQYTNVYCPAQIQRYGGEMPYVRVMESYPADFMPARRGQCWPAGHASGGFALLAFAGLARTRRGQLVAIALGLCVGGVMGCYQMAKGAHYLSHTLVTALLAWLVFLLLRRVPGLRPLR
jgi:membrane-associated PAP2 superfamily phosphatase